jgi:hypothetical protein
LTARLRQLKLSGAPSGAFSEHVASAARHACDEHLRLNFPNRHRLDTRLRYLLSNEKTLAVWVDDAGESWCGLERWRAEGAAPAGRQKLDRRRDLLRDVPSGRGIIHPADLASTVFERLGGPVPLAELVGIAAELQGVVESPPRQERADLPNHLSYGEIVTCSEGEGKPDQLSHIRECAWCQAEVQDLSRFRTELVETPRRAAGFSPLAWASRHRIPLGIAGAVLVFAVAAAFAFRRSGAPRETAPVAQPQPQERADPRLPPAEREILQRALDTGVLERAPVLDSLIARPPGPQDAKAPVAEPPFMLLAPVATTVLSDRPHLRWTAEPRASSYVVAIYDQSQKIAESPALTAPEWHPAQPLPRQKVLTWQVTARTPSGSVLAAKPSGFEPRFLAVAPVVAERVEAIRRDFPGNPLLLAALYAHAGALDDALASLQAMEPYRAQRYGESILKLRRPE